jgi:hypothetical protein
MHRLDVIPVLGIPTRIFPIYNCNDMTISNDDVVKCKITMAGNNVVICLVDASK